MTLLEAINKAVQAFTQPEIKDIYTLDVTIINDLPNVNYPVAIIDPVNTTITLDLVRYTLRCYVIDRMETESVDAKNQWDMATRVIMRAIKRLGFIDGVNVTTGIISYVRMDWNDYNAGAWVDLTFEAPYQIEC